jgi:TonB family protein
MIRTDSPCQRWGSQCLSLGVLLLVVLLPVFATGSEIEHHLRADYLGKLFIIRCLCSGDDLVYDMAGHVAKGDQTPESWTVSGLEITKVDLHENALEIRGQRVAFLYDPATKKFQRQNRFKLRSHGYGTELAKSRIAIQSAAPTSEDDWQKALAAVFTSEENVADLEGLPRIWRIYLRKQRPQPVENQQPRTDESSTSAGSTSDDDDYSVLRYKERPVRIGGRVSAPKPVSTPEPAYSEAAQASKVSGTVILWMVVDSAGMPRGIRITKPLGFGLDEKAAAAVERWQFKPAERDGEPVAVQMNVEVAFRLY